MKTKKRITVLGTTLMLLCICSGAFAHGVDDKTRVFLMDNNGSAFVPFLYIGAKHMLTGYDHLLFLVGIIFFLYKPKDILLYVSMFTIGHSITLLSGVILNLQVNAYIIDAIIAISVIYKGFDNLGGFKYFNVQPNNRLAVLTFGLFHGLGLATKLQEFNFSKQGLITNLIGFNIGVEIGQFVALLYILIIISIWRNYQSFKQFSTVTNIALMVAGFALMIFQLKGFFNS
ncbi:MAG: HupE/UreJ family protein [Chitinophagales bacterium]|nr:HupE/UreJ family protein [Chitinophagales bacterium]